MNNSAPTNTNTSLDPMLVRELRKKKKDRGHSYFLEPLEEEKKIEDLM
jgi:hypothetical protein